MPRVTSRDPEKWNPSFLVAFIFIICSSCTFVPSFSPSTSDLLVDQDPPQKPLFVDHPPADSKDAIWLWGHIRKSATLSKARSEALARAFDQFSRKLLQAGYSLNDRDKKQWFRLGSKKDAPHIAGQWRRTYKESTDRPYIHRISLYLLVKVPRSYEQSLFGTLARFDRRAAFRMESEQRKAQTYLLQGDGSRYLATLRLALKHDQAIHSLRSFTASRRSRILRERKSVEALWRKSLRAIRLSLIPPTPKLSLSEFPQPPVPLTERASIQTGPHSSGLSGLFFVPSLRPSPKPEHLVFPDLSWLVGNNRPILSPATLRWEEGLFRQPPYRFSPPLELACQPTGRAGTGECALSRVHVPGDHGFLEGFYRPFPGTPLDSPYFAHLLKKTLLDIHFRYYHRRALHPILLTIDGSGHYRDKKEIRTLFMTEAPKNGLTLCSANGIIRSCPGAPPASLLSRNQALLRIDRLSLKESVTTQNDISVATTRMLLEETLIIHDVIFWRKKVIITSRGFTQKQATLSAWQEGARDLARDLARVYYPERRSHPGEDFYDR